MKGFSYDQLLTALAIMGDEYEKIVEIFTSRVSERYGISTSKTYFDCTNFYFEIDRESDIQKKGPSKENRTDPIIGLGLLLDTNQLPIAMKLYPGNQSEKPVLRNVIGALKQQNNISGKTVQVADKGLNCAANIYA
ncbi:transposase, partial [[Clostridium] innocuum]|nr:transposase [[Clostridium] innocuum]